MNLSEFNINGYLDNEFKCINTSTDKVDYENLKLFMQGLGQYLLRDLSSNVQIKIRTLLSQLDANDVFLNLKYAYIPLVKILSTSHNNINGCGGYSKSALFATRLLLECLSKNNSSISDDVLKSMVQFLFLLPSACLFGGRKSHIQAIKNYLKQYSLKNPDTYARILKLFEEIEPKPQLLSFATFVCDLSKSTMLPKDLLISYVKLCFNDKFVIPISVIDGCKSLIQKSVENQLDFDENVRGMCTRMTLRAPEKALKVIRSVLCCLTHIDISSCSDEIAKVLCCQLTVKSDSLRSDAKDALLELTKLISDVEALKRFISKITKLLQQTGSEKITNIETRINIYSILLQSPSNISIVDYSTKACLVESVITQLIDLLQKENVDVLVQTVFSCIEKWSVLISDNVPTVLIDWFKTSLENKKNTGTLRFNYYCCMNSCFDRVNKLSALSKLVPVLKSHLEISMKNNQTISSIQDTLPVIDILLRYIIEVENVDNYESHATHSILLLIMSALGLKSGALSSKLMSDAFLQGASNRGLVCFLSICKNICMNLFDMFRTMPDLMTFMLKAIFVCSIHDNYFEVRKPALHATKLLSRSANGTVFTNHYLTYLDALRLDSVSGFASNWFWPMNNETYSIYEVESMNPLVHKLCQFISALFSLKNPVKQRVGGGHQNSKFAPWWTPDARDALILKALTALNQFMIVQFYSDIWRDYAMQMLEDFPNFEMQNKDEIIRSFLSTDVLDNNAQARLKSICSNFSQSTISQLVYAVACQLSPAAESELLKFTDEQVGIMNTREGYLYNRQMIESLPKYEVAKRNIKRENKNYSYKDQMLEIEMMKEMEARKKKNSAPVVVSDNPLDLVAKQLTKNQMEQVNNELAREKRLRNRMLVMEKNIIFNSDVLNFIIKYRSECVIEKYDCVLNALTKLISDSNIGRVKAALSFLELSTLTKLSRKESIWCLRILLLDSVKFNATIRENWKFNKSAHTLFEIVEPWCKDTLSEYSQQFLNQLARNTKISALDFVSFLNLVPVIAVLLQTLSELEDTPSTVQWYQHLNWMDLDIMTALSDIISVQLAQETVNRKHIFNSPLLCALVKSVQTCEDQTLHASLADNMIKITDLVNEETDASNMQLVETDVFEHLLDCIITNCDKARSLTLDCFFSIEELQHNVSYRRQLALYLWMMSNDDDTDVRLKVQDLWKELKLLDSEVIVDDIIPFIISNHTKIMENAVRSLTSIIKIRNNELYRVMQLLFEHYRQLAYIKPPVFDDLGRILVPSPPDNWNQRIGTGKALKLLATLLQELDLIEILFNFLIPTALADINTEVRMEMLDAGKTVIELYGDRHMAYFLPLFEDYLNTSTVDIVKQCVVIFLGALAKHLPLTDERFNGIFSKLIANLFSPSEAVQQAVSDTIEPLVKNLSDERQKTICDSLLAIIVSNKNAIESRGAAHGLAGILRAVGITKLKSFNIQDVLVDCMQDRKNEMKRQYSLFTFEQVSVKLGKKFEPYVPFLMKYLQEAFGDSSNNVRKAADRTAKVLMRNLSAPGVKLILNPLLEGLDSSQWRTKSISAEMLGSMAYCAPKQLSNCLPTIVPKILSILSDSHPNVIKSGRDALKEIGSVIQNKEMLPVVPILITALCEPNTKTMDGLDILIQTKFIHQVDAASLALIMSMVVRAFKERRSETKRKACQIIANLHSLTDDKDLQPYCEDVLPGLKACVIDPDPSVRTIASTALGTIAKVMSAVVYGDLLAWLMETLKDSGSGVNRSGAAQGLSEVLLKKGSDHLERAMPDILSNAGNQSLPPNVRDGYMVLYVYLPRMFGAQFAQYVPEILPSILASLSDEVEYIRETSLNAAQTIIETYSHIAIDTMLPNLERGLFDDNWRIRMASVRLLGDLLFKLIGITGKGTTVGGGEDETFASSINQAAVERSLGAERFNQVIGRLYLSRLDVSHHVRTTAVHVWKLVVFNTVRTLRQAMTPLMETVMECLSSPYDDNKVMATKAVADLVRKLGERAIPDIFASLVAKFESCEQENRIGVCEAFSAVLKSCPKEEVSGYLDNVLPTFYACVCDVDEDVRVMAVSVFDALHFAMGIKIVEIVVPELTRRLVNDENENDSTAVLDALCTLVELKGKAILPVLIPRLTSPRVHTMALSHLAQVAGDTIGRHMVTVLPLLFTAAAEKIGSDNEQEEIGNCTELVLAIEDPGLVANIMRELVVNMTPGAETDSSSNSQQMAALQITAAYYTSLAKQDRLLDNTIVKNHTPQIIRAVIRIFISDSPTLLAHAFDCFSAICIALGPSSTEYAKDVRDSILLIIRELNNGKTGSSHNTALPLIPGLCLSKGILPLVELYKETLINGRSEIKEVGANGMDDLISVTSTENLTKAAVKIAGPLIRTMSDRHSSSSKAGVVSALGKLALKCPKNVKLFTSQIMTIFLKCLQEPSQYLRYKSQLALAQLQAVFPKPDQLFAELTTQELADDNEYKYTGYEAVRMCLDTAVAEAQVGKVVLSRETLQGVLCTFQERLGEKDDQLRTLGAAILGSALSAVADEADLVTSLQEIVVKRGSGSVLAGHSVSLLLMVLCKKAASRIYSIDSSEALRDLVHRTVLSLCRSDKIFIASTAHRALAFIAAHLVLNPNDNSTPLLEEVLGALTRASESAVLEIKELAIEACAYILWRDRQADYLSLYVSPLARVLVAGFRAKETVICIKSEKRILDLIRFSSSMRGAIGTTIDDTIYKLVLTSVDQYSKTTITEIVTRFKKTSAVGAFSKEIPTQCPELDNTFNKVPPIDSTFA